MSEPDEPSRERGLPPTVGRQPLHRRSIEIDGYQREDGLYDIEGHLVDTKARDFKLAAGVRAAGEPIHGMWLRITTDRTLTIVDAHAAMDAVPYAGHCGAIVPHPPSTPKTPEPTNASWPMTSASPPVLASSSVRRAVVPITC